MPQSINRNKIVPTIITIKCPRKILFPKETMTNEVGSYVLEGKGVVEGCTIVANNPNYKIKEAIIGNEHIKDRTYHAAPEYEVNLDLTN